MVRDLSLSDLDAFQLRLTTECQTADINVVYEEIEYGDQLISLSKGNASIKITVFEDEDNDDFDLDEDEDEDYLNDFDDEY